MEKTISSLPLTGEAGTDMADPENPYMRGHSKRENREILLVPVLHEGFFHTRSERPENVSGGNADMNANKKSDELVVLATPANSD